MAEDRNIIPPSFKGLANEDDEQWVHYFEYYCEYRGLDDGKKLALSKILLTQGAATLLDSLSDADRATWAVLKGNFLERYLTPEYMHFRSARLIFNNKMQVGDAVDDYMLLRCSIWPKLLRPTRKGKVHHLEWAFAHISNYIIQQQPRTMPELLQADRIAELTTPVATETNSGVSLQLARVQEQLQKLTENGMLKSRVRRRLLKWFRKQQPHQHP